MIPFIILGLAAVAVSALGCSPTQTPPPATPPGPPKDPEDEPLTQDFGDDTKARWLHLQLKLAGVKDGELDQGCRVIQYSTDGSPFNKILGTGDPRRGDRRLQPCELYDYTLDRYENPKFRPLAEELAGRPIPWALDDHDPKTTDDALMRETIQGAIKRLDDLLRKRGLKPGQATYQEGMAVGLMTYLTVFRENFKEFQAKKLQDLDPKGRYTREAFKKLATELRNLGLGEFWKDLENIGGMAPRGGDYSRELTALEALLTGENAECTERSKILFAVFKMAGLEPVFLFVDPWKSENRALELETLEFPDTFHVAVGLKMGEKIRIFDPSLGDSDARHPGFFSVSLRQYLAMDFNNRGHESKLKKDIPGAQTHFNWARRLEPSSDLLFINLSGLALNGKDPQKAMEFANAGLALNPQSALLTYSRAMAWENMNKIPETLADVNHAIQLNSRVYKFYIFRGALFLNANKVKDAERDFTIVLRLAPRKGGETLLNVLIDMFTQGFEHTLGKEKLQSIEEDSGLVPPRAAAGIHVAALYWRADHRESALAIIKELNKVLSEKKAELSKEKKDFSPTALNFIKDLYDTLPPSMASDPDFKALWDPLGIKF